MRIAFGMIVFEGDYVLKQCLEQVYPFASQILIAEGPVDYWQRQGRTTSTDRTNEILGAFPDPENKITVVHGQYSEKDDQCRAYMEHIREDTDYLWNLDSDEVYKTEDLEKIIGLLEAKQPSSVGVQSTTFYGGFYNYLTGFELKTDNFLRIFRYTPGATWLTHRPPTLHHKYGLMRNHMTSDELFQRTGASMYHYSYVFPDQVKKKIAYYKKSVSLDRCIDSYFEEVYLPWVDGNRDESRYLGVHEFKPEHRGECYTTPFTGQHPESIKRDMFLLRTELLRQLEKYNGS